MAGLHGGVWPQPHPPEPGASNVQSADLQAAAAATPMPSPSVGASTAGWC